MCESGGRATDDCEDRRNKVNELKVSESVQNDEVFREAVNL